MKKRQTLSDKLRLVFHYYCTDAQHPISMSQIKEKLSKHLSGHKLDRKAIYDDFDALEAYGFVVHREKQSKSNGPVTNSGV